MIVVVVLAAVLVGLAWQLRRRRGERAANGLSDVGLGTTVDLIAVVIGSGGTVRQSIETVAEFGPEPVSSSFASVLVNADDGMLLADALGRLAADVGSSFQPLVGALVATERDGAPVSLLLQRLADDAEQARRWRIEALARRLPVTTLVPLVVCLLPATIVGTVVPLVIVALRHLEL